MVCFNKLSTITDKSLSTTLCKKCDRTAATGPGWLTMTVPRENFEAKIEHVGENLYLAHFHLKIHEKMTVILNKKLDEYPEFFRWSRMAHYETGILRLTRAYDQGSLGLFKIINIFKSNYKYWALDNTINLKSLKQEIENDINFVTEDFLVKGLVHLRDKAIAHTDNQLYPSKPGFSISEIFGGSLVLKEGNLTTKQIEKLPIDKRSQLLTKKYFDLFQAIKYDETKILKQDTPAFPQLYELTTKGVDICNRYMLKLGIEQIDLQLEGIT